MSYTIQYGPEKSTRTAGRQHAKLPVLIAAVLVPLLVLTIAYRPANAGQEKNTLLPWEQEQVQEAFSDFSASVQSGTSFQDAITALYRQILNAAQSE